jgi:hypothetical protein
LVELWLHLESAPGFFNNLRELHRVNISTMGDGISEPRESKMKLKFFACPTGKYHSAYSLLNELNLALTLYYWHNMNKIKILSFYPGWDARAKKPSHDTVPLKG